MTPTNRRTALALTAAAVVTLVGAGAAAANKGYIDDPLYIGADNNGFCPHPSSGSPILPSIDEHCTLASRPTSLTTVSRWPYSGFVVRNLDYGNEGTANGFAITGESDVGSGVFGLGHGGGAGIAARNTFTGPAIDATSQSGNSVHAHQGSNAATVLAENFGNDLHTGGPAVRGWSAQRDGVEGDSSASGASGVFGFNDGGGHGIFGWSTKGTLAAIGARHDGAGDAIAGTTGAFGGNGVRGATGNGGASGVYGENHAGGVGVYGRSAGAGRGVVGATDTGIGVNAYAASTKSGTALRVDGKATFSRSGVLRLTSGSSVTKTGIALTSRSLVIATLQTNAAGLYVQGAVTDPANGKFTISLSRAVTRTTRVAFMVLD